MSQPAAQSRPSPYERIGGEPAVARLVTRFYERVLSDPELRPFFEGVAMDKLRRMQGELFAAALGGPVRYQGRPIIHAHQRHHIALPQFQRFVQRLFEVLAEFPLTEEERNEVIGRINLYADEVTGQPGAA